MEQIKLLDMAKNNQSAKARMGAIGESLVVAKLMQQGWDAFNANCTIKNYKSIDIICLNSDLREDGDLRWKPKTALVQVKTCNQKNIPIGFTMEQTQDIKYLEDNVKGPYVLIYQEEKDGVSKYRFFVISRKDFIKLAYELHHWYIHDWEREKPLVLSAPAGFPIKNLMGEDEKETSRHKAFHNPFKGITFEDKWENIWKE